MIDCKTCHSQFYVPKNRFEKMKYPVKYCSKKCMYEGLKIRNICKTCGKEFWKPSRGIRPYCSHICSAIGRRLGELVKCEWCGKEVYKPQCLFISHKNHFCSIVCANKFQGRNKLKYNCKICGKLFEWSKSRIQTNNPTYCSIECRNQCDEWRQNACIKANVAQQEKKGLNKLEITGRHILEELHLKNGIDFQEQVLMAKKFLVDVVILGKKIVIQWDGDYWHSLAKRKRLDRSQDAYLNKLGYSVLRFRQSDLQTNRSEVYANIKRAI